MAKMHDAPSYNDPWEEDLWAVREDNRRAEAVLAKLRKEKVLPLADGKVSESFVAKALRAWVDSGAVPDQVWGGYPADDLAEDIYAAFIEDEFEGKQVAVKRDLILWLVGKAERCARAVANESKPEPGDKPPGSGRNAIVAWARAKHWAGEYDPAFKALAQAQEMYGVNDYIRQTRAELFWDVGLRQKAVKEMARVSGHSRLYYSPLLTLCQWQMDLGDFGSAQDTLMDALRRIGNWIRHPMKGDEYCRPWRSRWTVPPYGNEMVHECRSSLVEAVKDASNVVGAMEVEPAVEPQRLIPIKKRLLTIRRVLERHWREGKAEPPEAKQVDTHRTGG